MGEDEAIRLIESMPEPLSRRIKPGDVVEVRTAAGTWARFTAEESHGGLWLLRSRVGLKEWYCVDGPSWRLAEPAPASPRYTETPPPDALNRWESRRHNAHCPRCYGPAFHGAGALRCERVGGCLADVEPSGQVWCRAGAEMPERYFWHEANPTLRYATRELAVAAWRDAVIAKAKREAGL